LDIAAQNKNKKSNLVLEVIKIIAFLSMALDHLKIMGPSYFVLETPGRAAYPLFAVALAYSYSYHTRSKKSYLLRLFALGVISQPFFALWLSGLLIKAPTWDTILSVEMTSLNILFNLLGGLFVALLFQKKRYALAVLSFLLFGAITHKFSYGAPGVLMVAALALFFNETKSQNFHAASLYFSCALACSFVLLSTSNSSTRAIFVSSMLLSVFSLLIFNAKMELPEWRRWIYYCFYPVHLFVYWLIWLSIV